MKRFIRFAAVMLLTVLSSATAFAQWVQPTPSSYKPLAVGDSAYLYNVGTGKLLGPGEAWGTQAVVTSTGAVKVVLSEGTTEGTYRINNNYKNSSYTVFRVTTDSKVGSGVCAAFIDGAQSKGDDVAAWAITSVGDNVYTIALPSDNASYVEGQVFGVQNDHATNAGSNGVTWGCFFDVVYADNTANCQWAFLSQEVFDTYNADLQRYQAAQDLKAAIDEAKAKGADVSAAEAVYNNTNSTLDELTKALHLVAQAVADAIDPESPQDFTSYIPNADFASSHTGWTSTMIAQDDESPIQNNANQDKDHNGNVLTNVDAYNGKFWENWDPSIMKGKMYTKQYMPNGAYAVALSAHTATLADDNAASMTQFVYANDSKTPLVSATATRYNLLSAVFADSIEIGLEATDYVSQWYGLDEVHVTCYGNSLESFKKLADVAAGTWQDDLAESTYAQTLYDAVQGAVDKAKAATTKEDAYSYAKEVSSALVTLKENAAAYALLSSTTDEIENQYYEKVNGSDSTLTVVEEARAMFENHTATTEEINAMIQKLNNALTYDIAHSLTEGQDITANFIENPTFSENGTISTANWTHTGNFGGGASGVMEAWNNNFDIHQEIKVPEGAYALSIKNFYRTENSAGAYSAWVEANGENTGNNEVRAFVYADNIAVPFTNVFSVPYTTAQKDAFGTAAAGDFVQNATTAEDSVWTPNGVTSANAVFTDATYGPKYETTVNFISLGETTPVTIGLKAENIRQYGWSIWDEFKLVFLGKDYDTMLPIVADLLVDANKLADEKMNADSLAALTSAIEAANNAEDGDALLAAYKALSAAMQPAQNSASTYTQFKAGIDKLSTAIAENKENASPATAAEAQALYDEDLAAYNNGTMADADVNGALVKIELMIQKLLMGDTSKASDDAPLNFTGLIKNPTFETSNEASELAPEGWTITSKKIGSKNAADAGWISAQYHVGQGWNCSFDCGQTLSGLPEGTYKVVAQGFQRYGTFDETAKAFRADTLAQHLTACLYANGDSTTMPSIIYLPASDDVANVGVLTSTGTLTGWSEFVDSASMNTYFYPNTRQQAQSRFTDLTMPGVDLDGDGADDGGYSVATYCYVDKSGVLKLGFRQTQPRANGWVAATNFRLYYLGTESSHASTTGINNVNGLSTIAKQEVFSLDGRQLNSLQKGVNIVKSTDINGKTSVKKVIVK